MPAPTRSAKTPSPTAGLILVAVCTLGALASGYYALKHYQSYQRIRSGPEAITATQAFTRNIQNGPYWVDITSPLELDCHQALQETSNGSVDFTVYLARDPEKQHAFLLQYKGEVDCQTAISRGSQGLLRDPNMYWWTKNGMPEPAQPVLELAVDYPPAEELHDAIYSGIIFLVLAACTGVFWKGYTKARMRVESAAPMSTRR